MKNIIKIWLKDHGIELPDERIKLLETMIWCHIVENSEEPLDIKNDIE